jgi:hypothetical protein
MRTATESHEDDALFAHFSGEFFHMFLEGLHDFEEIEPTQEIPVGEALRAKIGPDCFDYLSLHLPPECRPVNDDADLETTQPLAAVQS